MQRTSKFKLAGAGFFLLAAAVYGNEAGAVKNAAAEAEDIPAAVLDPVEITAMRFGESLYDVPVSAQNIGAAEISESGLVSVPEVLQKYGNIYFRSTDANPRQGDISMRGFGDNSGQRVLVLLDGQRLNRVDMAPVNWSQIDLDAVENIEIIRGSQSALYGNYAIGGVIKITTKKWDRPDTAKIGGLFGTYGEYSGWGGVSHSTEDYYASVDANYYHNSGYRDDSLNWSKSAGVSAGARLDDKNELNFYANVGDEYLASPSAFASLDDMLKDPTSASGKNFETDFNYAQMSMGWENEGGAGAGSAQLGAVMREKQTNSPAYNYSTHNQLWTVSFTPRYKIEINEIHYVEAGVDVYYDNMTNRNYALQHFKSQSGYADINRETVAPWIAGKYQIDETFSLNAGGRYEAAFTDVDFTDNNNPNASYDDSKNMNGYAAQFGINAKLDETWNVYFRFDQVYRYPTIDESASYYGYGGGEFFNKDLDPERGQNYEIGVNFARAAWRVNLSGFFMHLDDEIMWDNATYMNKNIGSTDRFGSEVSIAYELKSAGVSTSWAFVSAKYDGGPYKNKNVPLVPNIVSYTQAWVKPTDFLRLSVGYRWCGEQYMGSDDTNSLPKMPAFWTIDLTADIRLCEYARMYVSAQNVTDETYATTAYTGYSQAWYPALGRTVRVGFEFRF